MQSVAGGVVYVNPRTTPPRRFAPPLLVRGGERACLCPPRRGGQDATASRTGGHLRQTTPPRRCAPPLLLRGGECKPTFSPPEKEGRTRCKASRAGWST